MLILPCPGRYKVMNADLLNLFYSSESSNTILLKVRPFSVLHENDHNSRCSSETCMVMSGGVDIDSTGVLPAAPDI